MEIVNIVGVDPSLRSTGLAILTYDCEKKPISSPHHCQVLVNPQKYTGKDAILNMLEMMQNTYREHEEYQNADAYLIESPGIMFNKTWSSSTLSLISHVAGGAVVVFGIEKVHLFRPNEWNKNRKKEVTHNHTIAQLGDPETWEFCSTLKSDKYIEHVLDAASIALFWLKNQYWEEKEPDA
jgi:hypothetical protein